MFRDSDGEFSPGKRCQRVVQRFSDTISSTDLAPETVILFVDTVHKIARPVESQMREKISMGDEGANIGDHFNWKSIKERSFSAPCDPIAKSESGCIGSDWFWGETSWGTLVIV